MSLTQNTTNLRTLLETINALPDYADPATAPIPADAIAALEEKGVDVADGANVSVLASLIAAIEAGGGGGSIAKGIFTPAEATGQYTLTHGLGKIPDFIMVARKGVKNGSITDAATLVCAFYDGATSIQSFAVSYSSSNGTYEYYTNANIEITSTISNTSAYRGYAFQKATANDVLIRPITFGTLTTSEYYWIAY